MKQASRQSKAEKTAERLDLTKNKLPTEKRMLSPEGQDRFCNIFLNAASGNKTKRIERLLKLGVDVNIRDMWNRWTALMFAAEHGCIDACALLIENGANIEAGDEDGINPLICAARNGHTKICALLIEKGANIEAKENERHKTALLLAACRGYTETCAFLFDKGANIDAKEREGYTAFMLAKLYGKRKTAGFLTFVTIGPKIFADKKTSDLFYSSFSECLAA
jgi:ankyrin repeat protein